MFRPLQRSVLFLAGFSLPIQGFSFTEGAFGFTISKAVVAILFMFGMLHFFVLGSRPPRDRKHLWILVFAASWALSATVAFLDGMPLEAVTIHTTQRFSLLLFYVLIGLVIRTPTDVSLLLWGLLVGGALTAAPAALGLQQASGTLGYGDRFTGLAGQANVLGFDMTVCLAAGVGLLFATRSHLRRGVLVALMALCLSGLFLSLSRAALVAAIAMVLFWLYRSRQIENLKYVILAGLVLAVIALMVPESVYARLETVFDRSARQGDASIQSRFVQYSLAFKAFFSSPLWGVGGENFMAWTARQPGGFSNRWSVHNAYLAVAAEQGLLGLVPYVAILLLTWIDFTRCRQIARAHRRQDDLELRNLGYYAFYMQIALLGVLVMGLTGQAHRSKTMWMVLALSAPLLALCRARVSQFPAITSRSRELMETASTSPLAGSGQPASIR